MEQREKYFETAFGAPDGIKKLRELILTLSFQGQLTPRQTKGQSVSELLQSIQSEKSKLIKTNKIKVKNISNSNEINTGLYELPKGWRWVRLRDISYDLGQKSPSSRFTYIDVGSVDNSAGMITDKVQILDSNEAPSRARKIVKEGTVIYSTVRPYLLNIAIVGQEYKPEPIASTAFAILHPYTGINKRYLYFYLRSPVFISFVEKLMKGVAYPAINDGDLFTGFIPLPPSKEQDEIVDKIDQLMSRCDELEKLRAERDQKRLDVHTTAIHKLLDAPDQATFNDAWQFITRQFGDLYTVRENVAELRKAILQLAVMGKLVPQDPKEGTARELVEEIEKEKRKMMKEGKMKEQKPLPPIRTEEIPFEVPAVWEWVRLADLGLTQTGTTPSSKNGNYFGEYIPFIGPGNIKDGKIDYSGDGLSKSGLEKGRLIKQGSIMMVCIGGSIGKSAITQKDVSCNQQINAITSYESISAEYLYHTMTSEYFLNSITKLAGGSATPIINKQKWSSITVPLPPKAEQIRISNQLAHLMIMCNQLDHKIIELQSKSTEVLKAVMTVTN